MLLAYLNYSGFEPTEQLSVLETITIFVLIPVGITAAVTVLWWLAGSMSKAKSASAQQREAGPVDWN